MSSSSSGRRVVVLGLRRALQARSRAGTGHEASSYSSWSVREKKEERNNGISRRSLSASSSTAWLRRKKKGQSICLDCNAQVRESSLAGESPSRLHLEFEPPYYTIARGGFSKVLKARHRIDNKEYAIKISRAGANEVRNLAALGTHDHIIRYFGSWYEESWSDSESEDDDETFVSGRRLCIQLELCANTLRRWLSMNDSKSLNDIYQIAQNVVLGLQHIHKFDLAHLDLATSNILKRFQGDAWVIADFGLTRSSKSVPFVAPSPEEGQKLYLSPERRCQHSEPYDLRKADIFSLGLIFFELISIFRTEMERCLSLEQFQPSLTYDSFSLNTNNHYSAALSSTNIVYPEAFDSSLVSAMLFPNPDLRPNINTILQSLNRSL